MSTLSFNQRAALSIAINDMQKAGENIQVFKVFTRKVKPFVKKKLIYSDPDEQYLKENKQKSPEHTL